MKILLAELGTNDYVIIYIILSIAFFIYWVIREIAWWKWQRGFMEWLYEYYQRYPKKADEWRKHLNKPEENNIKVDISKERPITEADIEKLTKK
jgi:hypothetical protein